MKKYIKYIDIELLHVGAVIAIDLITKEIIYNKALEDAKSTLSRMYCPLRRYRTRGVFRFSKTE